MNNTEFGYGSEMYNIVSGIENLLRESSTTARDISTIMYDLDSIRKMQKSEESRKSKGEYELEEGKKGTIYDKYEIGILKLLLGIKTEYWNPNYEFVSWEELFSKMDKVNMVLNDLRKHKSEFEDILLKSEEIKIRLDTISKYQLGPTKR